METSLLTTKLNIPPARPQLVSRPRLIEQLHEGLKYNLILVSSPAGFGKTTLLSEWARQNQPRLPTTWVSLDEGDNDLVRFWAYFVTSLKILQSNFGESTLALLKTPQPPPVEELLTVLINELAGISFEFALILDDYHVITSQQVHDGITYLLDHPPPQMHLMIATRADPPLPLAQYRGKGTMFEIRTDDLRINQDEAVCLLGEIQIPALSTDDIAALNDHTEGWAAGLKMAAIAMRRQPDIREFLSSFTGSQRYIMDYLIEEVLQQQADDLQDFLLKTSVMDRFCPELCDFITERDDSRDMIYTLENNNLFIVPLDESRQWYRYEHLFVDLLRHQCEITYGKEEIARLRRQASQWYGYNGLPDETIQYALAAKDWETAVRLITEQSEIKRKTGGLTTIINWIQALPEDIVQNNYQLCKVFSIALIHTNQFEAAESKLKILERMAGDDDNLKGDAIGMQAFFAVHRNDVPLAEELVKKAMTLQSPDLLEPYSVQLHILGIVYYNRGEFNEAEKLLTECYNIARQTGNDYGGFLALSLLGTIQVRRGKLHRAAEIYQQAIVLTEPSPAAAALHHVLGFILYELNDLEAAENHELRAIKLNRLIGNPERLVWSYHLLAGIRLSRGDETGAKEAIEKADSEAKKLSNLSSLLRHAAYHVGFEINRGNFTDASEWGKKLSENKDAIPWQIIRVPARLLIAQGQKEAAVKELQVLYEKATQSKEQDAKFKCRVYQALAAETEEAALEFLAEALIMAEPEGYIRTFVDQGMILAPILRKAISRGIRPDYAGKLLGIIEKEERQRKKTRRDKILLSERELEILQLMAAEASNQQIADSLTISLNTVKTHVRHILEKLNARDRSQAVFHARELEII